MRLPDFLIIGAAKSGTSSLYRYLERHPQIFLSSTKEPEFFASEENLAQGIDWYTNLFKEADPNQICGEGSTAYTRWPQCPDAAAHIAKFLPKAKLIYLLRHPIDRAYSHYLHRYTKELHYGKPITVRFEEHIKSDPMCLDSSEYMKQIERYLEHFPRESLLLLFTDEFIRDPKPVLRRVCQFLGVDPDVNILAEGSLHVSNNKRFRQIMGKMQMIESLKAVPGLRALSQCLPKKYRETLYSYLLRTPFGNRFTHVYLPKPMRPETRSALLKRFREPNHRLADFLGVDLSHWNT